MEGGRPGERRREAAKRDKADEDDSLFVFATMVRLEVVEVADRNEQELTDERERDGGRVGMGRGQWT